MLYLNAFLQYMKDRGRLPLLIALFLIIMATAVAILGILYSHSSSAAPIADTTFTIDTGSNTGITVNPFIWGVNARKDFTWDGNTGVEQTVSVQCADVFTAIESVNTFEYIEKGRLSV